MVATANALLPTHHWGPPSPATPLPRRRRRPPVAVAMASSSSGGSARPVVLGCGAVSADYLATVASFPNPDDKIRSLTLKVQGGGNTGNALTAAARLGLSPRIISKVANDAQGRNILKELQADGVDTSYILAPDDGNSPFTYIIVDNQTKTRTCIHTPGYPPMVPEELTKENLFAALDGADIVYFDVRLHETALIVAEEASQRKIPILIDAERKREGLDKLLTFASYVVCSAKFPQAWTGASSVPVALVSILSRLPNIKFVIVTLGDKGCIMLDRSKTDASEAEEVDVEALLESLEQNVDRTSTMPKCIASKPNLRISADGVGSLSGRLLICTAEVIPQEELIDTTGAGDAFIGAVLYGQYAACWSFSQISTIFGVFHGVRTRQKGPKARGQSAFWLLQEGGSDFYGPALNYTPKELRHTQNTCYVSKLPGYSKNSSSSLACSGKKKIVVHGPGGPFHMSATGLCSHLLEQGIHNPLPKQILWLSYSSL